MDALWYPTHHIMSDAFFSTCYSIDGQGFAHPNKGSQKQHRAMRECGRSGPMKSNTMESSCGNLPQAQKSKNKQHGIGFLSRYSPAYDNSKAHCETSTPSNSASTPTTNLPAG
jgi:hypothetical protein